VRRRALELRAMAETTRAAATTAAAATGVEWRSLAADRFRELLRHEAERTRRCADLLDTAADALARHAAAVDR
jgi:hypothetical protein